MRALLFFLFSLLNTAIVAQPIDYYPERKPSVSAADYDFAKRVLDDTYQQVKQDGGQFTYADYWNLAIAFKKLDQSRKIVREYLFRSKELNPEKFVKIFDQLGGSEESWSRYLSTAEYADIRRYNAPTAPIAPIAPGEWVRRYDPDLIETITRIAADDQRYRSGIDDNPEAQRRLDAANLAKIDRLYGQYGRYLGKDLVGAQHAHVMWAVIQHSDPAAMERYLPVVHKAVQAGQLKRNLLKMLLDRVYSLREGYQLFGSQQGVPLAPAATIDRIRKLYGIR